jgi:hypothetical protein
MTFAGGGPGVELASPLRWSTGFGPSLVGGLVGSFLKICALAAVLLLSAGCGNAAQGSMPFVSDSPEDEQVFWQVEVTGAWSGDVGPCVSDPAVASSWQSADMPSSHLGLVLVPDASEADAARVAQCLHEAGPENKAAVRRGTEPTAIPQGPPVTGALPAGPDPSAIPEPGTETSCDPALGESQIREGNGTISSTTCMNEEPAPLTREEMMNATPMPMPVLPAPTFPLNDPPGGSQGDSPSKDGTAGRARPAPPATPSEGR